MDMEKIEELFDACVDDFMNFDSIENKRSNRPDLHAFLLLDSLFPGNDDMVCAAGHDIIYLNVEMDDFQKIATEELILELLRCGVCYDEDSLAIST